MGEIEVITKSRLAAYNKCQRYHHLTYNLGYRTLAPRELMDFGSLFHAGLDAWWRSYKDGVEMVALSNAIAAMAEYRASNETAIDDAAAAKAEILMAAYDVRWAPTMVEWDVLRIEAQFVVVLPGRKRLRIAGKLDKLVRRRADGSIWFVEHKTSGADLSVGSTYWQRLRMDPQVSIYHLGVRELGHEPAGCLYDVIERPAQKPLTATPIELRKYTKATAKEPSRLYANQRDADETVYEFRERLAALVGAAPEAYLARAEIVRLDSELEASMADVEETALQIRAGSQTGVAPRNPGGCFEWNRPCDFLDACGGMASLDDPTRFKKIDSVHQELDLKEIAT